MNEDLKRWDDAAVEWAATTAGHGMFRPYLISPTLKKLLEGGQGRILDAGCGDGIYTKLSSEMGYQAEGIDGAESMVTLAQKNHPNIKFTKVDLLEQLPQESGSFDIVLSILVLMSLSKIESFLRESFRILNNRGFLIVVVRHPAFSNPVMVLYKSLLDKILFRKPRGIVDNYYLGKQDYRTWDKGSVWNIPYYHRTFEQYSSEFKNAGFLIDSIFEPNELPSEYLKQYPKLEYATRLPRFIFFKLIKAT